MNILITGVAGFIGSQLAKTLLQDFNCNVMGIDNFSDYYDVNLKTNRIEILNKYSNFKFNFIDITNKQDLHNLVNIFKPNYIIHLAAQAGVRFSHINRQIYLDTNIVGFNNILEVCLDFEVERIVYASSSSVYSTEAKTPLNEKSDTSKQASYYGATKKCNEITAYAYAKNHNLKLVGLRLFSVYGPWGRPDMAPTLFCNAIKNELPLNLYNNGLNYRDFTYIDDIIQGIIKATFLTSYKKLTDILGVSPILNLGNQNTVQTLEFVKLIEKLINKKAIINYMPPQSGDMFITCADISLSKEILNYSPKFSVDIGMSYFVNWFNEYYK
jgi:UDP-glucuronate 4-epimerase